MSARNARYAAASWGWPRRAMCQSSIWRCSASRSSSSARLRGASSVAIAAKPRQKSSGATPVPGITTVSTARLSAASTSMAPTGT